MRELIVAFGAPFFGWLADRHGLRSILIFATTSMAVLAIPLFSLINVHHVGMSLIALGFLGILTAAFDGPLVAYMVKKFDVTVRHTGVSLSYNLGAALFGGLTPIALTYFIDKTKIILFPSFILIGVSLFAFFVLLRPKKIYSHHS